MNEKITHLFAQKTVGPYCCAVDFFNDNRALGNLTFC